MKIENEKKETIEIQKELFDKGSKLKKYQTLILGEKGFFKLLKYELIIGLTSWVPGALGLLLRSKLYPCLMGSVGRNVTFGSGVVLRHPKKVFIGDNVIVDDNCVLDAKGQNNKGIFIGNGVFLGRNTILNCKNGDIIPVKLLLIDDQGRFKLSRKAALAELGETDKTPDKTVAK